MGKRHTKYILARIMQTLPGIIPLIAGSTVYRVEENLQSLSVTLSKNQLEKRAS